MKPYTLSKYRLAIAIAGAIAVSLIMTVISVGLYVRSGVASLDLSRPGYEQAREQVSQDSGQTFEASGPINEQSLKEFRTIYQTELKQLQSSSDFSDQTLEDAQLRFTPETQSITSGE